MKLENRKLEWQLCSLELAKELRMRGCDQEDAAFYWYKRAGKNEYSEWCIITHNEYMRLRVLRWSQEFYAAFTVAELDEFLAPIYLKMSQKRMLDLMLHKATTNPADYRANFLNGYLIGRNM